MRSKLGITGEQLAIKFLIANKFEILDSNYTCPLGEIDIIAQKNSILYFIEVKTRSSDEYGSPLEAVDYKKQQRLSRIATYYIMVKDYSGDSQFGVVAVMYNSYLKRYTVELIANAFDRID